MRTKPSFVLVSLFFICLSLWLIAPAVAQQRQAAGAEIDGVSGYYLIEIQTGLRGLSSRAVVDMLKWSHFTVAEAGMNIVIVKSSGGAGTLAKKVAGFAKHLYRLPIPDSARASCFDSYRPLDRSLAEKWNHEAENYPRKANSRDSYADKTHPLAAGINKSDRARLAKDIELTSRMLTELKKEAGTVTSDKNRGPLARRIAFTETRLKSLQDRLSRLKISADPGKPALIYRQSNNSLSDVHRIEGGYEVNLSGFRRLRIQAEDGSITGKVTDASTAGIENVHVNIYDLSYNYITYASTDSAGDYTVPGLATGSYKVLFNSHDAAGNYVSEWYNDKADFNTADAVSVTAGSVTSGINAQLAAGGSITGKVTNASSAGIENVYIEIRGLSGNYINTYASTDSAGDYTVPGLATGSYKVGFDTRDAAENYAIEWYNDKADFNTADAVSVTAGNVTSGINAQLAPGGSITGKVTNASSAGIENVYIVIVDLSGDYVNAAATDSAGNSTVPGLATGSYKVYFYSRYAAENYVSEWYNDKADFDTADTVSVTAGSVTSGINAQLAAGGSITGKVTNASTAGIENVNIYIIDLSENYVNDAYTDSAGDYTVPGLATGSYKVGFDTRDAAENYAIEWYNDKAAFNTADTVSVTAGSVTSGINAQLAAGGSITGKVTDASNAGIENVRIEIHDLSENYVIDASTDSAGDYTVNGLAPGSYKIYFNSRYAAENYVSEWYNGKANFDSADSVSVTAGSTTSGINAQLAPGGAISGTVTNGLGTGINGIGVSVYDLYNNQIVTYATDSTGAYEARGIPSGSYKVYFDSYYAAENCISEWYDDKADFDSADAVSVTAGSVTLGINAVLSSGIIPATITATSPNGGESWAVGSAHNVTWTSTGTIADVKIEYSTNSGTGWTTVIASTTNSGTYPWTVPATPSATCLVRVSDASNAAISDVSDAVFTIVRQKDDLLGSWAGQGVYYRNSDTGAWVKLSSPATKIAAGDLDDDGIDDLIGIWPAQGGVWVKYSKTSAWAKLSTTADWISAGDMNGDGKDDLLGTWAGQGVYYRNSANGAWVKMSTPATKTEAGDLDGDGIDDLIGIWPTQGGVWVKYSKTAAWVKLSSTADWISAGRMRTTGATPPTELIAPLGGYATSPGEVSYLDYGDWGPGGPLFVYEKERNLAPRQADDQTPLPGPGEPGFRFSSQENLHPPKPSDSKDKK